MYISILLHLIKTHELFYLPFYEKVGIVGGFGRKSRKNRIKRIGKVGKLEAQGPCTGHRRIIAILYCFSFKIHEKRKGKRSDSVHKFMWIKHFAPLT